MGSTFFRRIEKLDSRIGHGKITASVKVDQLYARYQHERMNLNHHGVGGPKFLTRALFENHDRWYTQIANHLYSPLGVNHWMVRISKNFKSETQKRTPVFLSHLKTSAEARVKEGGAFIYRGPHTPRLSKRQVRAKAHLYNKLNGDER